MDLYAYAQIPIYEEVAKENGIEIPRLRGYRLMSEEEPFSVEAIKEMKKESEIEVVENLCEGTPFWSENPVFYSICDERTDRLKLRYLNAKYDSKGVVKYTSIRWNRIHGKKRKILKFMIKKKHRAIEKQYGLWNKYAGKENVLYIHSRIGGSNFDYYDPNHDTLKQPWFLDRVDDYFDTTYCDFYAKIKPIDDIDGKDDDNGEM